MSVHYELPIFSFLAVVLVILPLPWHWKARNVATLSLIGWLALTNLVRGINSIVWLDNVRIHDEWWCDISTKIFIGVSAALPACSFCITRNLEYIASARVAHASAADKCRRRIIDLCLTVGFPILTMALHYIVQGHRFDILAYIGCQPSIYVSVPSLFIIYIPPLALSVGSLIYASLALRHFFIRRAEFERHLSQSALTTSRYLRLMALAVTEILWGSTLGAYIIFLNIAEDGLRPWISWADVHLDFGRIALFPDFLLNDWQKRNLLLSFWITPATAFLFFLFFGFSEEALEGYASALRWVLRVIFRREVSPPGLGSYSKSSSLPRYTPPRPLKLGSFAKGDEIHVDLADVKSRPSPTVKPRDFDAESVSTFALSPNGPPLRHPDHIQTPPYDSLQRSPSPRINDRIVHVDINVHHHETV